MLVIWDVYASNTGHLLLQNKFNNAVILTRGSKGARF